jgi:hypothetical protein
MCATCPAYFIVLKIMKMNTHIFLRQISGMFPKNNEKSECGEAEDGLLIAYFAGCNVKHKSTAKLYC